jgi:hypothetical protein
MSLRPLSFGLENNSAQNSQNYLLRCVNANLEALPKKSRSTRKKEVSKTLMKNLYSFKEISGEYYVFQEGDPEPFDGPMTKEEAETLTENFNETPEPDEYDASPAIREMVARTAKLASL